MPYSIFFIKNKIHLLLLGAFLSLTILLYPFFVFAQSSLIPCSGNDCGTCELVQLANNITDIIIILALGISVLIFIYAGWLILSSAGNSSQVKKGKDVMTNVVVGLIIILTAWLVIDVMLKTLLPNGQVQVGTNAPMPWNQIFCSDQIDLNDGQSNFPGSSGWQIVTAPVGNGFANPVNGLYFYKAYVLDSVNNCKIAQTSSYLTVSACYSAVTAITGNFYLVSDCDGNTGATPSWSSLPVCGASANQCSSDPTLIALYNGSPRGVNAPGLQSMISCYTSDSAVSALLSSQPIYTFDNTNPVCGPTNGSAICSGRCSHSPGSCHYGAGTGQGAMAGDFNAADGSASGEQALYNAIRNAQSKCGGKLLFEGDHTHVSLNSCPGS